MKKQFKYTSLVAAGAVTLGLVGGTLAWFTSTDSVTNNFATVGNNQSPEDGSSIKIAEVFAGTEENPVVMTPGRNENKDVQVHNIDNYDQFIRAKITVAITEADGTETTYEIVKKSDGVFKIKAPTAAEGANQINYDEIELHLTNLTNTLTNNLSENLGKWVFDTSDNYFYYIGKVAPGSHTNNLLDSVKLTTSAGEKYKKLTFEVNVDAEGIQTTYDAAYNEWSLSDNLTNLANHFDADDTTGEPVISVASPTSSKIELSE